MTSASSALPAAVAILAASILLPNLASAGDDLEAAKAHFRAAQQLYVERAYDEALREFQAAYAAKPLPDLLFNVGQCHNELGNLDQAIAAYEGYLRDKPQAGDAADVRKFIGELQQKKRRRDEEDRAAKQRAETAENSRIATQTAEEAARLAKEAADAQARDQKRVEQQLALLVAKQAKLEASLVVEEPFYKAWWFWPAVGGAAVVVGTTVFIVTRDREKEVLPAGQLGTIDLRP